MDSINLFDLISRSVHPVLGNYFSRCFLGNRDHIVDWRYYDHGLFMAKTLFVFRKGAALEVYTYYQPGEEEGEEEGKCTFEYFDPEEVLLLRSLLNLDSGTF